MSDFITGETRACLCRAFAAQASELRSDRYFFGGLGAFLGFAANAFVRAEQKGLKVQFKVVNDLLSDFMSVKANILVFCLVALVCAARNIVLNRSGSAATLSVIAKHSAARLRQLSSSLTCFALGFAIGLGLTVAATWDVEALLLSALVALVGAAVSCFAVAGSALHERIGATGETWCSVLVCVGVFAYMAFIAAHGF